MRSQAPRLRLSCKCCPPRVWLQTRTTFPAHAGRCRQMQAGRQATCTSFRTPLPSPALLKPGIAILIPGPRPLPFPPAPPPPPHTPLGLLYGPCPPPPPHPHRAPGSPPPGCAWLRPQTRPLWRPPPPAPWRHLARRLVRRHKQHRAGSNHLPAALLLRVVSLQGRGVGGWVGGRSGGAAHQHQPAPWHGVVLSGCCRGQDCGVQPPPQVSHPFAPTPPPFGRHHTAPPPPPHHDVRQLPRPSLSVRRRTHRQRPPCVLAERLAARRLAARVRQLDCGHCALLPDELRDGPPGLVRSSAEDGPAGGWDARWWWWPCKGQVLRCTRAPVSPCFGPSEQPGVVHWGKRNAWHAQCMGENRTRRVRPAPALPA